VSAPRHIGIVAGSVEGAALCYRTLCLEAPQVLGEYAHPEVTLNAVPMAEHLPHIRAGHWEALAEVLAESSRKVARAGAEFVICPDNTYHAAFKHVAARSPIPWLHIAEAVAAEARRLGYARLGILGTQSLTEGAVYREVLEPLGIASEIPDADDRRRFVNEVATGLKARGCDAVVLGCTELPLLVRPDDTPLPTLDSTRLLARAALQRALR
jgi:aspartate racemase